MRKPAVFSKQNYMLLDVYCESCMSSTQVAESYNGESLSVLSGRIAESM